MNDVALYKVVFDTEDIEYGQAFKYLPTKKEAKRWIKEECPHNQALDFDLDVQEVSIKGTKRGLVDYLNDHHIHW